MKNRFSLGNLLVAALLALLCSAQSLVAEEQPKPSAAPFPGKKADWHGFARYDFEVDGKSVLVVAPEKGAAGRPWVWHGEFFGHKPEPDIALLKQGFHIVYMSVPDMLGSPQAVEHWNKFYAELAGKYGLARRAALVGLSRGGLYCYNWGAANPDKVACIYGDAPVCDFKSWPGGKGKGKGSPRDWKLVLERYSFKDDAEALAYTKNPVDNLEPLAKAKVPLLHVYGDADDVVPWEENTGLIAERYRKLGGEITLIAKKGVGHHPHGLEDSTPIVDFISKHASLQASQPPALKVGENWPGWRGPRGDGSSLDKDVPVRWDVPKGECLIWKVPLAGSGHASPVIWDERIFIVACDEELKERTLSCLDRANGSTLWKKTVFRGPLESKHALNSFASSTPATDGKLVFVSFLEVDGSLIPAPNVGTPRNITPGKMVVAAYDFDGNQKWLVKPGPFISAHGYCASPVLFENFVIINGDHDGDSYLVALDKQTGNVKWKIDREHKIRSYVTPLIREIGGRTQLILSGSKHILSLDPRDGSRHWVVQGPTEQYVASMVYDGKLLFMAAGYPTYHVLAIRPSGRGDVTETHVAWHETNVACYVPSPVVVNGYLIVPDDRGTVNCFAADTGERLWQERLGPHFSTSAVTASGLVYLIADDGRTKVIRPGPKLETVADNALGESCYSSPAIAHDRLYIRGEKNLYCIGK